MKVIYELKVAVDVKEIKEIIKPIGGRCAKIEGSQLHYQIKEENEQPALALLKEKGYV